MTATHTLITSKIGTGPFTVEDFINDGVSLTYKVMLPPSVVAGDIIKMETSLFKVKWVVLNPDETYTTKSYNAYTAAEVSQHDVEQGYTLCRFDLGMLYALRFAGDYRTIVAESVGGFFETKIKVVRSKALSMEGRVLARYAGGFTGMSSSEFQGKPQTPFGYLAYDHAELFSEADNRSLVFNEYAQENRLFSFEGRFRIHPILQEQIVVPEQIVSTASNFWSQSVINTPEYFYLMCKADYLVRAYHGAVWMGAPTYQNAEGNWLREDISFKANTNIPLFKHNNLADVLSNNTGTAATLGIDASTTVDFQIQIVKEKAGQTTSKNVVCTLFPYGMGSDSLGGLVVITSTSAPGTSTSYAQLDPFLGDQDATYSFNILNTPTLNGVGIDLHFTFDSVLTNVQKKLFGFSDVANTSPSATSVQYSAPQTTSIHLNPTLSIYDGNTQVGGEVFSDLSGLHAADLTQCTAPRIRVDFTPSVYLTGTVFHVRAYPGLGMSSPADMPGSSEVDIYHTLTASEAASGICYVSVQDDAVAQMCRTGVVAFGVMDNEVKYGLSLIDYHTTDEAGREFILANKFFEQTNTCHSYAGGSLTVDMDVQGGSGTLSVSSNDTFITFDGAPQYLGVGAFLPCLAAWTSLSDASAQFWSPECAASPPPSDILPLASFSPASQRGIFVEDAAHYGTSVYDDPAWDSQSGFKTGVFPPTSQTVLPVNTTSYAVDMTSLLTIKQAQAADGVFYVNVDSIDPQSQQPVEGARLYHSCEVKGTTTSMDIQYDDDACLTTGITVSVDLAIPLSYPTRSNNSPYSALGADMDPNATSNLLTPSTQRAIPPIPGMLESFSKAVFKRKFKYVERDLADLPQKIIASRKDMAGCTVRIYSGHSSTAGTSWTFINRSSATMFIRPMQGVSLSSVVSNLDKGRVRIPSGASVVLKKLAADSYEVASWSGASSGGSDNIVELVQTIDSKISSFSNALNDIAAQNTTLLANIGSLNTAVGSVNTQATAAKNSANSALTKLDTALANLASIDSNLVNAIGTIDSANTSLSSISATLTANNDTLDIMAAQVATTNTTTNAISGAVSSLNTSTNTLTTNITEVGTKVDNLSSSLVPTGTVRWVRGDVSLPGFVELPNAPPSAPLPTISATFGTSALAALNRVVQSYYSVIPVDSSRIVFIPQVALNTAPAVFDIDYASGVVNSGYAASSISTNRQAVVDGDYLYLFGNAVNSAYITGSPYVARYQISTAGVANLSAKSATILTAPPRHHSAGMVFKVGTGSKCAMVGGFATVTTSNSFTTPNSSVTYHTGAGYTTNKVDLYDLVAGTTTSLTDLPVYLHGCTFVKVDDFTIIGVPNNQYAVYQSGLAYGTDQLMIFKMVFSSDLSSYTFTYRYVPTSVINYTNIQGVASTSFWAPSNIYVSGSNVVLQFAKPANHSLIYQLTFPLDYTTNLSTTETLSSVAVPSNLYSRSLGTYVELGSSSGRIFYSGWFSKQCFPSYAGSPAFYCDGSDTSTAGGAYYSFSQVPVYPTNFGWRTSKFVVKV